MNFDNHIFRAQALQIEALTNENHEQQKRIETLYASLDRQAAPAKAWNDLAKQVSENPVVAAAWEDFLIVLKMGADEEYMKKNGGWA